MVYVGSLTVPAHNIWADAAIALGKQKYPGLKRSPTSYPVSEDQNAARQTAAGRHHRPPEHQGFPDLRQPGRTRRRAGGS